MTPPKPTPAPSTDRGQLTTEQVNPATVDLDTYDSLALVQTIQAQDAAVIQAVQQAADSIAAVIDLALPKMKKGGRLIYLGAGTSGRLGVLDASEIPPTFCAEPGQVIGLIAGGDTALRQSSEGAEDDWHGARNALDALQLTPNDTLVGIAAGGTTPYVHGALAIAQQAQCATVLMTCVAYQTIEKLQPRAVTQPDIVIELLVGPEVLTGSTRMKAGTATKLALNTISTGLMTQLGKVWGNLMVDVKASNAKLVDRAIRLLISQTNLSRDQAHQLLIQADGRVKTALVMHALGIDRAQAIKKLAEYDGQLRPLIGGPKVV